jgi:peptide chain release factor 2
VNKPSGGIFDYDNKIKRLQEINLSLEDPNIWNDVQKSQALGKERAPLERITTTLDNVHNALHDAEELLQIVIEEQDEESLQIILTDLNTITQQIDELEFQRMFANKMDPNNAYMDIQAGSGGTEAQDWAEMLLRMYLRWGDQHNFKTEIIELSPGEVAGIKSATIKFTGEYCYGWLRTETGVHRLVRKSPFDSGNRRHTSFASVFVSAEIDEDIDIDIHPADLRIDTYRSQGAGGQHVNTTDSAVRVTHKPSGVVVQCQNNRSQHQNRAQAMQQLRAKLYEIEIRKQNAEKQAQEEAKLEISWGSQIRSYVLDDARIKDLRTKVETRNPQAVLDGDIDMFIEESLKQGV